METRAPDASGCCRACCRFFSTWHWRAARPQLPLDIGEIETAFQLTADLPRLEKGDIGVDLHENTVTVSAEHKDERATDGLILWRERSTAKLSRTVQLPQAVNVDPVKATYVNGALQLTMPNLAATETWKLSVA
jgi:HSP20 family protein